MSEIIFNHSTFLIFAAKNYINHCFNEEEFFDDLKKIKYIKRLFNRYIQSGELKERILLNHIIILFNVFEHEACVKMLFLKLEGYHKILKPFLVFLNFCPNSIIIDNKKLDILSIEMDKIVIEKLRQL
jgi:hypothetical protein